MVEDLEKKMRHRAGEAYSTGKDDKARWFRDLATELDTLSTDERQKHKKFKASLDRKRLTLLAGEAQTKALAAWAVDAKNGDPTFEVLVDRMLDILTEASS